MKQKPAELGEFQGYFFNSVFSIKISFESDNSVNFYDFLKKSEISNFHWNLSGEVNFDN